MRLIFDNERNFLKKELNIDIPKDSAFMNKMCVKVIDEDGKWISLYRISCSNMKLELKSNNLDKIKNKKIKTWNDLILDNKEHLDWLEVNSKSTIKHYLECDEYKNYKPTVTVSGGKDSAVVHYLVNQIINNEETVFSNTSNETHYTYKYVKSQYPDATIISPDEGFYQFVDRTGFIPTRFGRACCTTQKEMPMIKKLSSEKRLFFMGMRKAESNTRAGYNEIWRNKRWGDKPWTAILPILNWSDLDVLLFMLYKNIPFNPIYTFGFGRCGCTNCPFRSDYELLLNKIFLEPYYNRWMIILEKDFINNKKAPVLNCTLEEYKNGAWKSGRVREKATEDIIKEFSEQQNIEIETSRKYFNNNTCSCCGKKIKQLDVGLSLKFYGRHIKKFKCIKCISKDFDVSEQELKNRAKEFKDKGCTLF